MKYLATINVPGYLPTDDDPPTFDTPQEAWSYLCGVRWQDEFDLPGDEWSATYNTLDSLGRFRNWRKPNFQEWLADEGIEPDGTGAVWGDTPGANPLSCAPDLGLVYNVMAVES